jgi:hypothetical protein
MTAKETQAHPMPKQELNPASVFARPMQVVNAKDLTTAEMRALLRSWETDARALQRADDEGMQIGERSRLHDVEIALACLDAKGGEERFQALAARFSVLSASRGLCGAPDHGPGNTMPRRMALRSITSGYQDA